MLSLETTDAVRRAARHLAECRALEMQYEDERAAVKLAAILRLMAQPDPTNPAKTAAATTAEKYIETDEEYSRYIATQRQAVVNTIIARAQYEIAVSTMRSQERGEVA